jgi:hypothetical protein
VSLRLRMQPYDDNLRCTRITVSACHLPPLGVAISRAFSSPVIALSTAVNLGRQLQARGRPKKGEEKGGEHHLKRNTAPYLIARLERDAADDPRSASCSSKPLPGGYRVEAEASSLARRRIAAL